MSCLEAAGFRVDRMNLDNFETSLADPEPPPGVSPALQALWWDARGNWKRAHALAQADDADPRCAWVHGYLHRKEGDLSNAAYWYRRAGRPIASGSLRDEWRMLASALLTEARDGSARP